ncbi:alpha-L-arabinofuranosidase C-terminal domain-containing protein [Jeotgalibaca ciconiae]|uniref:non-reducing end alpha-L-arabinofuranosidase n=1 Tax=Jeotgalibaca ciconiae TaxID=2496265 RepID=A0A3Q9BJ58_9LACT|nr:alpha-L-arabinofuranosidase C-terminal domain-containing protein [Jeotgalibaca ciconiae]AZP03590.1 alpha-N-arabinofuranosidase [Jeotgalibaca ciconiae]
MIKIKLNYEEKLTPLNDLYGLFFEDLNHAADGGLYAEMIHNRSFEFCKFDNPTYHSLYAWEDVKGEDIQERSVELRILSDDPLHPKNSKYLKINSLNEIIIRNRGYNKGLYLQEGEVYRVSFFAKPDFKGQKVTLQLEDVSGQVYSETTVKITEEGWTNYQVEMIPTQTVVEGRLALIFPPVTDLAIDMISVFPKATFKGRKNGCRKDLAEKLAAMKPKFMRFPGGCLVHDGSLSSDDHDSMYRWKNTIGSVEERPTKRTAWGYNQSLGLGFFEYFQLCEDLEAKPIPVLPAGWDPHHQRGVPFDELGPWVQDALDLIEFANGDVTSTWGKVRAEMGHPESFKLEYLGIGNEEVGQEFFDRYVYFHQAIREAYPNIKLINSSGPFSAGSEYDRGWDSARKQQSDIIDEHYYASPEWFLANHHRYDSFNPKGPKVFLGEYAAKGNQWWNALAEASYMIGLERNADKVALACYAPLFANIDYVNWAPDLIWFDQEKVYGSINYEVQKLFMTQQGTYNVSFEIEEMPDSVILEDNPIIGEFGLSGDWADITIESLTVTDKETGESIYYDTQSIKDNQQKILGTINSKHYTITFDFTKTGGKWDKGFKFLFGRKDDQNQYGWSLGGWQNQDCLISNHKNGSDSVLTQSIWKVETNKKYFCCLEVENRQIVTTINGEIFNETEDLPLVIKPAYINSVYDQEKDVYRLKIVNVREESFLFELDNSWERIDLTQLSAALDAENSLEDPQQVIITKESIKENRKEFKVEPYSVLFLEIKI